MILDLVACILISLMAWMTLLVISPRLAAKLADIIVQGFLWIILIAIVYALLYIVSVLVAWPLTRIFGD